MTKNVGKEHVSVYKLEYRGQSMVQLLVCGWISYAHNGQFSSFILTNI